MWRMSRVRVEPLSHDEVAASDEVFGWRREVYGAGAVSGGPGDRRMVAEAVEGMWYVLVRGSGSGGGGRLVTVMRICDARQDVDTGGINRRMRTRRSANPGSGAWPTREGEASRSNSAHLLRAGEAAGRPGYD
jgi:hypothetical protein